MANETPRLTRLELLVHGLAQGVAAFLLVSSLFALLQEPEPYWLLQAALASLVLALSLAVVVRRAGCRPASGSGWFWPAR